MHDKLYRSESLTSINFGSYLTDLVTQLVRAGGYDPAVDLQFSVADINFPVDNAITCGLIINELVGNSLKHASAASPALKVSLAREEGDIAISIWDNGTAPLDPDIIELPKTLGLNLVKTLSRQLGGTVLLHRNGGTEFKVVLPKCILDEEDTPPTRANVAA